jgi:hypothetical protein
MFTMVVNVFKDIVFVRYLDHVQYSRAPALVMSPQTRETVGWLVYECEQYLTLSYDRDTGPPTVKGGDPKASGLVLLKSVIIDIKKLDNHQLLPKSGQVLNLPKPTQNAEYALQSKERKTRRIKHSEIKLETK